MFTPYTQFAEILLGRPQRNFPNLTHLTAKAALSFSLGKARGEPTKKLISSYYRRKRQMGVLFNGKGSVLFQRPYRTWSGQNPGRIRSSPGECKMNKK